MGFLFKIVGKCGECGFWYRYRFAGEYGECLAGTSVPRSRSRSAGFTCERFARRNHSDTGKCVPAASLLPNNKNATQSDLDVLAANPAPALAPALAPAPALARKPRNQTRNQTGSGCHVAKEEGEKFRNWRGKSGLTIDSAALALGVSRNSVIRYQDGRYHIPGRIISETKIISGAGEKKCTCKKPNNYSNRV